MSFSIRPIMVDKVEEFEHLESIPIPLGLEENSTTAPITNQLTEDDKNIQQPFNPLDLYADDFLVEEVENLKRNCKHLQLENKALYNFLKENDESLLDNMEKIISTAKVIQERRLSSIGRRRSTMLSVSSQRPTSTSYLSSAPSLSSNGGQRINLSQKTDLILREFEHIQNSLNKFKKQCEIKKDNLEVEIEELTLQIAETEEAIEIFRKSILIEAVDELTQKIPAEKFIKYMDDWLKGAQFIIDKLRLRTSALKVQYQKICNLVFQKQLLGENLHEIDFEKLEIENKHVVEQIEEKTLLLLELKKITGAANLALTDSKKNMRNQIDELHHIQEEIAQKEKKIELLDDECDKISIQLSIAKEKYYTMKEKTDSYEIPDLADYIKKKALLEDLTNNVKSWKRKIQVKDMAINTLIAKLMMLTKSKKAKPEWFSPPCTFEEPLNWDDVSDTS